MPMWNEVMQEEVANNRSVDKRNSWWHKNNTDVPSLDLMCFLGTRLAETGQSEGELLRVTGQAPDAVAHEDE